MLEYTEVELDILRATGEHFATKGYHDTVVADIAEAAGVGKGTVYRHFGKKKQLLGSLVEYTTRELLENIRNSIDHSKPMDILLGDLLDIHFDLFETNRHLVEILVKEGLEQTGEDVEDVLRLWSRYRSLLEGVFRTILDNNPGWIVNDPTVGARIFAATVWGHFRERIIFDLEADPETYKQQILKLMLGGQKNRE